MKASTRSGKESRRPTGGRTRSGRTRAAESRSGKSRAGKTREDSHGTRSSARTSGTAKKRGKRRDTTQESTRAFVTQNRLSMFLAGLVLVILLIAVAVNAFSLNRKLHENRARANILQQEIRTEEQRAADIEEYRRYTETDAYIEEIAREKLGLIYEGETVFKEEK